MWKISTDTQKCQKGDWLGGHYSNPARDDSELD